jgi:hypothetical protein
VISATSFRIKATVRIIDLKRVRRTGMQSGCRITLLYPKVMQALPVQDQLRRRLGRRYTATLWTYLQDKGYVEDVTTGAEDVAWLVQEAAKILNAAARPATDEEATAAGPQGPPPGQERVWALSRLVAEAAAQDEDVVRFRQKHLDDQLLEWADVEAWLQSKKKAEGPITKDLTITLPADVDLTSPPTMEDLLPYMRRGTGRKLSVRVLDYAIKNEQWVHRMSVSAGGCLDRLRLLSEELARGYGWVPAQATVFVLTGIPAVVPSVRVRTSEFQRRGIDTAWANRIVLDLDPACTPEEVSSAFQAARQQQGIGNPRSLSVKHMRLAAFACAEHVGKPWLERFELWNREFPHWPYTSQSNFRRDAIQAQYRLLYPGRHRGSEPIRPTT